jgi:hypothetical protein
MLNGAWRGRNTPGMLDHAIVDVSKQVTASASWDDIFP